jgi:hypothetical protein
MPRNDLPIPDPALIVTALLEIRTMRDLAGRDRIAAVLPADFGNRIPRGRGAYQDVCGFVDVLSQSDDGLALLLEALFAVEGASRPVQQFAQLLADRERASDI